MRTVEAQKITDTIIQLCMEANFVLGDDSSRRSIRRWAPNGRRPVVVRWR